MTQERFKFKTEQDYFEVGSEESANPFNLTYLTSQQTGNNKSTYETEQDYFEVSSEESANPFDLKYINNESMEITGPDNYSYREFSQEAEATDFYKVENLFNFREFEIFSNEVQDQEFKNALDEIASDSENKFQSFMQQNQGDSRYFEHMLADPNFERNFDQFFEIEYNKPLITNVQNEFERLSNYVEQNSHPGMNYEEIHSLIDSFEVEPEHFFGKLAKLGKSIVNKGIKLAKGGLKLASKVASKVGKTLLAGPLLKMITNRLKNSITPLLKSLLEKVKGKLPEQYRGLAEKAFGALTQTGAQANVQENGSSAGGTATAGTSNADTDIVNTSGEIFELYESESEGPDEMAEITELEHNLDKQIYLLAQNFENAQENLYFESEELGLPPTAAIAEQFLDREQQEAEMLASTVDNQQSGFTILDNSKDEFVSGIANNTMEIRELTQNFVPVVMAAMPAIKTILKLTGGRQKIVNLISNMAAGVLGNIIGKDQAGPLSKILVDKGLTLLGLEIPEPTPNQYLGATISNVIAETTDKVSHLPENILNGDEVILRSFVNEALLSSIANNFPPSVLNHSTNTLRELPAGMNWISEKNGYYQILNKEFQFVLKPEEAAKIYTRRGETLLDNLSKYQGWDGKTPIPVIGYVFQSNPLTRLAMIARDYAGGDSSDKKRQIIRLNIDAATILFKEPSLAKTRGGMMRGRFSVVRWYYIKLANSSNKNQTFTSPIQSTSQSPAQSTTPILNENIRANDVQIKIVEGHSSQYQLKVNIYLNEATSERIKSVTKSVQPTSLYKELESILIQLGGKTIGDMLIRLAIPQYAKNQIRSIISSRILDNIRANLHLLAEEYLTQSAKDEFGVTILIEFGLPGDFMKNLTNLSLANVGSFISKLTEIRPLTSIKSIAGYKL